MKQPKCMRCGKSNLEVCECSMKGQKEKCVYKVIHHPSNKDNCAECMKMWVEKENYFNSKQETKIVLNRIANSN